MRARIHQGWVALRARLEAWRTLGLFFGMLGFGLLAALGAYSYIQERIAVERSRIGAAHERVEVLVAARSLQRGDVLGSDNLAIRALPREVIPGGGVITFTHRCRAGSATAMADAGRRATARECGDGC